MQVEVAVLGFPVLIYCPYGLCGRKAPWKKETIYIFSRDEIRFYAALPPQRPYGLWGRKAPWKKGDYLQP